MRLFLVLLAVLTLGLTAPHPAAAAGMDLCNETTVQSLHHCVMHAYEMGHITNSGVVTSLLAKVDAAQQALDRGQPATAIHQVQAFIQEVRAQAGRHIDAAHADHMIAHAAAVIAALQP
jgi:hypothetical protein